MVKIVKRQHNGVEYLNFENDNNSNAVCCVGEKRFIIKGKPKIVFTNGSYKFDKELQFSLISKKEDVKEEVRNNSKWNSLEICLPFEEGKKLIEEVYKKLKEVEK